MRQKESEIQYSIIQYLKTRRDCFFWKQNTVGIFKKDTGSYIPSTNVGAADICVVKDGIFYGLEVKKIGSKQSPHQKIWQENLERAGGIYAICRSIDDARNALDTVKLFGRSIVKLSGRNTVC